MSERDKYTWQAEALEALVAEIDAAQSQINGASIIASCVANQAKKLRALAAQQPEAVEPVAKQVSGWRWMVNGRWQYNDTEAFPNRAQRDWAEKHGCVWEPFYVASSAAPQASAPAEPAKRFNDATLMQIAAVRPDLIPEMFAPADQPKQVGTIGHVSHGKESLVSAVKFALAAAPADTDLDALVADDDFTLDHADDEVHSLRKFFGDDDATAKLFEDAIAIYKKRITDLRAQLTATQKNFTRCANNLVTITADRRGWRQTCLDAQERITRLEAENVEARELLATVVDPAKQKLIAAFLAKGATP